MFALQLSFDGKVYVKHSHSVIGEIGIDTDICLNVLRVIDTEYKEVYRLISERLSSGGYDFFVKLRAMDGELHVKVRGKDGRIFPAIETAIFPLRADRLNITYIDCSKTYVIKPNYKWIKKDLEFAGVIK